MQPSRSLSSAPRRCTILRADRRQRRSGRRDLCAAGWAAAGDRAGGSAGAAVPARGAARSAAGQRGAYDTGRQDPRSAQSPADHPRHDCLELRSAQCPPSKRCLHGWGCLSAGGASRPPRRSAPTIGLDVVEGLATLVEHNLVRPIATDGEPRFTMLETLREYALEQLAKSGEADELRRRHAEYFLAQVETAEPYLDGPDQAVWFDYLAQELDNLRAVLSWSLASND